MRVLVVTSLMFAAFAARAGEWFVITDPNLVVGSEVVATALVNGNGFTVSHDAGANTAAVHATIFSLDAGPDVLAPTNVPSEFRPAISHDGVRFYLSGDGAAVRRSDNFALPRATNNRGFRVLSMAADPLLAGRAMVGFTPLTENASLSNNGFDSFTEIAVGFSAGLNAMGLSNNNGIALATGVGVFVSSDVGNALWQTDGVPPPGGLSDSVSIAGNVNAQFLAVGVNGAAILVGDTNVPAFENCSDGGATFSAVSSLGLEFWIARVDGTVIVVDVTNGCPWTVIESHIVDAGATLHALHVASEQEVLAISADGRIAWRNRPPFLPTISRQGAGELAAGATDTLTATADDPDLGFTVLPPATPEVLSFQWTCDAGLTVGATNQDELAVTAPDLCADASFNCVVRAIDAEGLGETSAPLAIAVNGEDTAAPSVTNVGGNALVQEGASLSLTAAGTDDCTAANALTFAWSCDAALGVGATNQATLTVTAPNDLCPGDASSFTCSVVARDQVPLASVPFPVVIDVDARDTGVPSASIIGEPVGPVAEDAAINLDTIVADDCDATLSFAWDCSGLIVDNPNQQDVVISAPDICPDPANPALPVSFVCAVTVTDDAGLSANDETTIAFDPVDTVPPQMTAIGGVPQQPVFESEPLSFTAAASDDCSVQGFAWEIKTTPAPGTLVAFDTLDANTPFNVAAPALPDGVASGTFAVFASAIDVDGNRSDFLVQEFDVVDLPPLDVTIACPASIVAGETVVITAQENEGSGPVQEWIWVGDGIVQSETSFTVTPDACAYPSTVDVSVTARGLDADEVLECLAIPVIRNENVTPQIFIPDDKRIVVVLFSDTQTSETIQPDPQHCPQDAVQVTWDLSLLPRVVWPPSTSDDGILTLSSPGALRLRATSSSYEELNGVAATITATASDDRGASAPIPVEVSFSYNFDEVLAANVNVALTPDQAGTFDDGELVVLTGSVTSDIATPLPSLRIILVGGGLTPIASTVEITSACGVFGSAEQSGDDAVLELHGVRSRCAADLRLLARRGLGTGGISVAGCTFADGKEIASCSGGLDVVTAPALSCASTGTMPVFLAMIALVLVPTRRRLR